MDLEKTHGRFLFITDLKVIHLKQCKIISDKEIILFDLLQLWKVKSYTISCYEHQQTAPRTSKILLYFSNEDYAFHSQLNAIC